ncbi:MAG TPA: hypothetical protein VHE79_04765 [Spirochaetia bacterium]
MKNGVRIIAASTVAAAALFAASCASVNHLDGYDFSGATLSSETARVSEPRIDVGYHIGHHRHDDVIGTTLGVLTNIALATQADHAERTMRDALDEVDVPSIVEREALRSCARALGAEARDRERHPDFTLSLEIEDWGITAVSGVAVTLRMHVTASLYHAIDGLVWRRTVDVDQAASSEMFGLPGIVGTMVTTNQLYEMTQDDMEKGFTELARHVARRTSRALEDDLDAARRDW